MRSINVACILIERNGSYLFIRQDKPNGAYPNTLHLPGGCVEVGETPEVAAIREAKEEVGLEVVDVRPVDFDWDILDYKGAPTILTYLRFTGVSSVGEAVPGSDAKEVLWVSKEDLMNHLHNEPTLRMLRHMNLLQ